MTIAANDRKIVYTGNGSTTVFAYDFPVASSAELLVTLKDTSNEYDVQALTTDYTVTVASNGLGNVTFLVAPPSGYSVIIEGATPLTQATDYVERDRFPASSHEAALDKLTKIGQEQSAKIARSLALGPDITSVDPVISSTSAGYLLRINSDNTGIEAVDSVSAGFELPTPVDGGFVVGNGTEFVVETGATARASLGLAIGTDVQAYDPELAAIAGLTSSANTVPYFTGSGTAALATVTSAARTVLDDATVSDMVDTLGGAPSSGTGGLARTSSPTLTTPTLGAASATSINKVTITAPATGSTLTIANGKTLTASNTLTLTGTDSSSVNFGSGGTVLYSSNIGSSVQAYDAELAAIAGLTSSADTSPYFTGSGTAALMSVTSAARTVLDDTSVSAMVDTLGGAASTGSGGLVRSTSPSLVTPSLGVAGATSINKVTITAPATGSTLTIADGKTLTASNTLIFTGTDSSTVAFGTGGTVVYSGANSNITSLTGLTGTIKAPTSIQDSSSKNFLSFTSVPSSVNYFDIANQSTGSGPEITSTGTDSNVNFVSKSKGTGQFFFVPGSAQSNLIVCKPAGSAGSSGILAFSSLSADRTYTFPNVSGNVITSGDTSTVTNTMISSSELKALGGVTSAANKVPYFTGSGTAAVADFSSFGRTLVDDADASAGRATLGLGTISTQAANSVAITGGTIDGATRVYSGTSSDLAGNSATIQANGTSTAGGMVSKNASATTDNIVCWNSATSGNNSFLGFYTEGSITARGSITYNRTGGLTSFNTTSDQRLKENITDAPSAYQKIKGIKIRSYDWKETGFHFEHGVIAQELVTVSPEAVSQGEDKEDGSIKVPWGVNPSALVFPTIKALQELMEEVESLREEVALLRGGYAN